MSEQIAIAVALPDPALAERVAELLARVPGLRLVADPAAAQAVVGPPPMASPAAPEREGAALTRREGEVLGLLAEGASNKEIARRLGISVHTAKFHVRSLMDKVEATGRTDALAQAARMRLIAL